MLILILACSLLSLTMSLLLAANPLTLGLSILLMALLVASLFAGLMSSWFAFLIFLIYVGGMLVMFSYFVALTPNQPSIMLSHSNMVMTSTLSIIIISYMLNLNPLIIYFSSFRAETLLSSKNSMILISLALLLLLTMVIAVKISSFSKGPLRAFMAYV